MGVAHRFSPVSASMATQYSEYPAPSSLDVNAKARPWLTTMQLNPFETEVFLQSTDGPPTGHVVSIGSGDAPSVFGPRYCVQSDARDVPDQDRPEVSAQVNTNIGRSADFCRFVARRGSSIRAVRPA